MNKAELVAAMAEKAGLTKVDAAKALNAYVDVVKDQLKKGEKVTLIGFGTFDVVSRPARTGRNPRTGAKIKIAAKKSAKFRAGKGLI
jgi:DNA-binding protein HU-beta